MLQLTIEVNTGIILSRNVPTACEGWNYKRITTFNLANYGVVRHNISIQQQARNNLTSTQAPRITITLVSDKSIVCV